MPDLYFHRAGPALIPADDRAEEWLQRQKDGRPQILKISSPRNPQFHKKAFKLLGYAYANSEQDPLPPFERWREDLTILAGYFDVRGLPNGQVAVSARSISFGSMDQETFEAWYSAMIDAILKHVLTQHTKDEVVRQVLAFG